MTRLDDLEVGQDESSSARCATPRSSVPYDDSWAVSWLIECEKDAKSSRKDPLTKDKLEELAAREIPEESDIPPLILFSVLVAFRRIDFRLMFLGADNEVNLWVIYEFAGIGLINRDKGKKYIRCRKGRARGRLSSHKEDSATYPTR